MLFESSHKFFNTATDDKEPRTCRKRSVSFSIAMETKSPELIGGPKTFVLESLKENVATGGVSSFRRDKVDHPPSKSTHKEVVVIGNGPSGITLSYLLAGYWPYYNEIGEDINEMLHYRLLHESKNVNPDKHGDQPSLIEMNLKSLSQGLEGRSKNPVSLLFDELNHPKADLGLELPSLLKWRQKERGIVDHVVIGKGRPGGAWQTMEGSVLTISLGCWMELPGMSFRAWESNKESKCVRESRANVSSVAEYYCDYVKAHELGKYFQQQSVVTEVKRIDESSLPIHCCDTGSLSGSRKRARRHTLAQIPYANYSTSIDLRDQDNRSKPLWRVSGYTVDEEERAMHFSYETEHVVLATGASDKANVLDVPGEDLPFVLHSLNDLELLIDSGHLNDQCDPILIVGAGLSAADGIIAAKFHNIPVIHSFRRNVGDKNLIFKQLPENMYPEYHKVHQMMQDPNGYEGYHALEASIVEGILPDKTIVIRTPEESISFKVSYVVSCIGSHPDLSFLGGLELQLGRDIGLPVDCKRNPIDINYFTHESIHVPGIYAVGPLVGENFVRFLQGGALSFTNHYFNCQKEKSQLSLKH